jgi:hypothetical protein
MKIKFLMFIVLFGTVNFAQENDKYIENLKLKYAEVLNINCDVDIEIDVEGITITKKTVNLRFVDNEPIISGNGISLLPKKGVINQFNRLLATPFQAIFLSKRKDNRIYKLVSLDEKSDWITADLEFDEQTLLVSKATINTRKFGTFEVYNTYTNKRYPSKTKITFNIKKFTLPLKFIGRTDKTFSKLKDDEITEGKVYLYYTYID